MVRKYVPTMSPDSPDRRRPPSRQVGRPPALEQDPLTLAEIKAADATWRLAHLRSRKIAIDPRTRKRMDIAPRPDSSDWLSLKLYALTSVVHKANYWISWHPEQRRFAARGDKHALTALRPDLLGAVLATMTCVSDDPNGLYIVRPIGDAWAADLDAMYNELFYATVARKQGQAVPAKVFADSELPQLKHRAMLINTERLPHLGWRTVRDELTGGFTLEAK